MGGKGGLQIRQLPGSGLQIPNSIKISRLAKAGLEENLLKKTDTMKKIKFSALWLVFLAIAGWPLSARAQRQTDEGWQVLFNGKDLRGWKQLNGAHKFEVKDGMILGTTVPGQPNGFLCTEKEYGDFILELEVSIDTLMNNSGIQFRSLSHAGYQNGRVHGYQMEVDPKPQRWSGSIYDEARRGWLYTLELNPAAKTAFKNNRWNKYRIECFGTSNRTWVNGVPTAHLIDAETTKGFIGLQLHANNPTDPIPPGDHQIRFRNIRIKTTNIRPSPPDDIFVVNLIPNNLSAQEKRNGYALLWDGKTTQGWRGAGKASFPESGWEIRDGELRVAPAAREGSAGGGDIITQKQYGPFELKFDFKLSEGANSGVKFLVTETKGKPATALGLEYQLIDDEKHPDAAQLANTSHSHGSLYDLMIPQMVRGARKKTGQWNQAIIRVLPDNQVEYWLNGYKILAFRRGSPEFLQAVATSKFRDRPQFGMVPKGHILLQDHGDAVSFRSIKIRPLETSIR